MSNTSPAGWYPQPDGSQRYWDGAAWTAHHQPAAVVPAPPAYLAQPGYAQPGYAVAPKNPTLALIVSFFVPGVGTMINGETGKGIGILGGYVVGVVLSIILIGIPIALGFWIWGMVDAYQGAQKWNAAHGIRS